MKQHSNRTIKSVTVSAPGKLMLFGEHAVIYGHPCIVTAVGQRLFLTITLDLDGKRSSLSVEAPDVGVSDYEKDLSALGKGDIPKGTRFIEFGVKHFFDYCHSESRSGRDEESKKILHFNQDDMKGLHISTKSEFSSEYGFGSSSASTVCVIKALAELHDVTLTNKELFDIAYKTVIDVQGKGSGFDVAAAIYGGTLSFVSGGEVIESLAVDDIPLIVGYSGVKADTKKYIDLVAEKVAQFPDFHSAIFTQIDAITTMAKFALIEKDWKTVGELMDLNQGYLEALGVSTGKLSAMIYAARDAGAIGAKLSGAGGGDCIVAFSAKGREQRVREAIVKVGGEVIEVETNVEGVRIEK